MATNSGQAVYAGFWARVAAYIVDVAILVILGLVIGIGSAFAGEMGMLIGQIVYLIINLLYWPVMESSVRQATFGKSLVGIQVTDLKGNRMSFLRAFLRNLAKIISAIPLGIGYLLAAFTGRKQALHDMITKSLVVRTGPSHFVKALVTSVGALAIAVGGSAAYFYYVIVPKAQNEIGEEIQAAMKSTMNPAPALPHASAVAAVPKPPVVAPSAPMPATPQPVPASASAPAPVVPQPVIVTAAPEPVVKPVPEPVKPAPRARKSPSKKTGEKPAAVTMAEPSSEMSSMSAVPAISPKVFQQASEVLPQPVPIVTFAPDTESRIIRPKYNDVMTAVLRSDREAVKQLLDLGWWVDKPGADGFTPLAAAVMNRDTQMVKLLLDHGAFPSSQALKLARERKDTATASLLEQRGAR